MTSPVPVYLNDLLSELGGQVLRREPASDGFPITGLAYDSRSVETGFLFAAVPGFKVDGHEFIGRARDAGAAAVLTERWIEDAGIPQVQVPSVRKAMAFVAAAFYGNPSKKLSLIGVTGTNGKTTTTYMIDAILREAGMKTGLIGGIEYRIGGTTVPARRTTPEAIDLQRMLNEMCDSDVRAATMEVSSHGIDLYRVACLDFTAAVFTNLTRDHLDLHGSMEHYFQAKRSLFAGSLDRPGEPEAAIGSVPLAAINIDDRYGQLLAREFSERATTFGLRKEATVRAGNIEYAGWETGFDLITPEGQAPVRLHLPGAYNLENALGSAAAALAIGITTETIAAGLSASRGAPGRFEPVDVDAPFRVVVDYAHNEDGLAKALTAARSLTQGKLILVFGCPGERDRDKRPAMGRTAGSLADTAILTTDDCYGEPPEQILDQTEPGLIDSGVSYLRIMDRREAIEAAVSAAAHGDTILIAGKGHETSQIIGDSSLPFNDSDIIKEIIAGRPTA
ncbi:MAG: UDP-N-acetylmuramoyl-L-alanyl-D-glutamate--2,6-diaminopimelate ligase [Actinobacteria bacterium]|nr:UDP-N-acetylmuramoyl-L-alanyl-D-glutamate--2,6-diaminopimelate ligase [Actinomycetota bacterium]